MNLDKIRSIIREMNEEAPTMSVAASSSTTPPGIAGINPGESPPVHKKKKKERKYMKGPGRKVWLDFLKGKK
jgi:hypothetical protein